MKILTTAALLLLVASTAWAQPAREELKNHPGYFDFGDIAAYSDGEELVEIDLTQPLLSFVGRLAESEEPELGDLLAELLLVNVRVFSFDRRDEGELLEHMENIADQLRAGDWQNIVRVRGEESANVFVKLENDQGDPEDMILSGLAILAMEDEEAVFVNVVGNFGMEEISRVGRHFDIPHMQDMDRDRDDRRSRRSRDRDDGER